MNERTLFPLIDQLARCHQLTEAEYAQLIRFRTPETAARLAALARTAREAVYGTEVYTRGLIEVSNFCRNDCYYCGIRRSNQNCDRYRLSDEDILACCAEGYQLGFRTFVLQGGEDGAFSVPRVQPHSDHQIRLPRLRRDPLPGGDGAGGLPSPL